MSGASRAGGTVRRTLGGHITWSIKPESGGLSGTPVVGDWDNLPSPS